MRAAGWGQTQARDLRTLVSPLGQYSSTNLIALVAPARILGQAFSTCGHQEQAVGGCRFFVFTNLTSLAEICKVSFTLVL